jgi:cell division protease FtsH
VFKKLILPLFMNSQAPGNPPPRRGDDPRQPPDFLHRLGQSPSGHWRGLLVYLIIVLAILWFWQDTSRELLIRTIPYSQFKSLVSQGLVTNVVVQQNEITGRILSRMQPKAKTAQSVSTNGAVAESLQSTNHLNSATNAAPTLLSQSSVFRTVRVDDPNLVADLEKARIAFTGKRSGMLTELLWLWVLPLGAMYLLWRFLSRRMAGLGQSVMGFGSSRAKLLAEEGTRVTFSDVAGCEEAKFELQEVVSFLKDPGRYKTLGATMPKGILLVGPPGTGKTLLARAVAGEAKVPFFLISGSDFVEMFVGVGASRVRDLFEKAKAQSPCIVFIDELDAVGRQRGVHMGPVNDEREQTLNQLLVGMDGFEANAGVIVLAATNRPEVLDRALLRPGRFDRQVLVDAPDLEGRLAILKLHVRDKPLAEDADLRRIAAQTPGFAGADLANITNEAALLAARHGGKMISHKDLEDAVDKVVAGPERKSRRLNDEEKRRVAYHEVGHALVAAYCKYADPIHKITIIPHGRAALGYTMQLPEKERYLMNRSALLDKVKGLLGGRAAEEVVFQEISTGAENDLERATALARQMVAMFGMSDVVGLAHCARREGPFDHTLSNGSLHRDCSEQTAREIDEEVKRILDHAYAEARALLQKHRDELERIARELLKRETMDARTFKQFLQPDRTRPADTSTAPPNRTSEVNLTDAIPQPSTEPSQAALPNP